MCERRARRASLGEIKGEVSGDDGRQITRIDKTADWASGDIWTGLHGVLRAGSTGANEGMGVKNLPGEAAGGRKSN